MKTERTRLVIIPNDLQSRNRVYTSPSRKSYDQRQIDILDDNEEVRRPSRESDDSSLMASGPHRPSVSYTRAILVSITILITEFCERLTYYSLVSNMVIYCTAFLGLSSATALNANFIFTGVVYVIPVFAGWLSDSITGRFNAIYGAALLYLVGTVFIAVSAFNFSTFFEDFMTLNQFERVIIYMMGLGFVALGTGGIKANVSPFGAEQLEHLGEATVRSFFNWFYWFVNLGAALAYTLVAYLQQEISYFYGYLVPVCAILLAIFLFAIPKNCYNHVNPAGSAFTDIFRILISAYQKKRISIFEFRSALDYARLTNGGEYTDEQINDVLRFCHILPVSLCLIVYWFISLQISNIFVLQGTHMNLDIGSFKMPVASLNVFNTIVILVATPIFDRIFYPLLMHCFGKVPTMLQRMGIGMLFAASAVAVAGIVEVARKDDILNTGGMAQNVSGQTYNASTLSVFYQVPQYVLVGFGEVFTSITTYEFAFAESPLALRSIIMGIFLVMTGLGSFLGSAIVDLVNISEGYEWLPNDINEGHVEYFFFLSSGLMLINLLIYIMISRWYNRKKEHQSKGNHRVVMRYAKFDESSTIDSSFHSQN